MRVYRGSHQQILDGVGVSVSLTQEWSVHGKSQVIYTQGGPLLANFLNIVVNAVVHKWMRLMRKTLDYTKGNLAERIEGLFAVFYIDDKYIASCNAEFL
jgi:hypothetical protein